jgi:hypothetical protein
MKLHSLAFALLLVCVAVPTALAQNEKEMVIRTARALETNPLDKETIKLREQAMRWVIETDQVSVGICSGVFGLFSDKKNKNSSEMTASYTVGMAAFKLEHPEQASDEKAAQLAGLESALKTYEAIVTSKPKTKNDDIEALLVKRKSGELPALIASIDCSKR